MRGKFLLPLAAIMLAAAPANAQTTQADAAKEKLIPCSVQAHGMSAIIGSMAGKRIAGPCDDSVDPAKLPLDQLIAVIPDQHPAFYYTLAMRLFDAGRKEDAVFWFYAGQLRYRIRLGCHPGLAPDVEPALLGLLQNDVGQPINEWAGGDPKVLEAAIEHALAWDSETRNGFEPKEPCKAAIDENRAGLKELLGMIVGHEDEMRARRTENGLKNR